MKNKRSLNFKKNRLMNQKKAKLIFASFVMGLFLHNLDGL